MRYEKPGFLKGSRILPRVTVNFAPVSAQTVLDEKLNHLKEIWKIRETFKAGAYFIGKRENCL